MPPEKLPRERICVVCRKPILPGHERTTIQGRDYHARCFDREARKATTSSRATAHGRVRSRLPRLAVRDRRPWFALAGKAPVRLVEVTGTVELSCLGCL